MQGFHNLFDSYSANTWKLNVTILKINVIIQKRTISISSEHAIHNTLFSFRVKKKCNEEVRIKQAAKDKQKMC